MRSVTEPESVYELILTKLEAHGYQLKRSVKVYSCKPMKNKLFIKALCRVFIAPTIVFVLLSFQEDADLSHNGKLFLWFTKFFMVYGGAFLLSFFDYRLTTSSMYSVNHGSIKYEYDSFFKTSKVIIPLQGVTNIQMKDNLSDYFEFRGSRSIGIYATLGIGRRIDFHSFDVPDQFLHETLKLLPGHHKLDW